MEGDLLVRPAKRTVVLTFVICAVVTAMVFVVLDYMRIRFGFVFPSQGIVVRVLGFIGVMIVGYVYVLYLTTSLRVSSDELTRRSGIITRNFARVQIDKITNYNYHRSLLELILGLVDLEIESSGATDVAPGIIMRFLRMRDASAVMRKIRDEKDAFNTRLGHEQRVAA
jgi:uncharacterized membrane protein YdbT with pleckstrin-like domain